MGYNYYGSLVSQCWFDGDVVVYGGYDYTGGIAGYNSKEKNGHHSIIEDCWSAGTVQGNINAGGIVGQNQVEAITRRCYSRSALSVRAAKGAAGASSQQGAGGIAGYNAGQGGEYTGGFGNAAVENCVALNPSIVSSGGFDLIYRVVGDGNGTNSSNLARADMQITISGSLSTNSDPGANAKDGADCAEKPPQSVYADLGWDFTTVWKMGVHDYPVLRWQQ